MQPEAAALDKPAAGALASKSWWPKAKRAATIVFLALVAWLLAEQARGIEWGQVLQSLRTYSASTLGLAAALALASYALYCTYDLFGRHQTGHDLSVSQVAGVGFVSYAFNLNLGALVGGVGMRYKLYDRLGLSAAVIAEVWAMSLVTNWLGYLLLAGGVFVWRPLDLPAEWLVGAAGLRLLGAALLLCVAVYLALCGLSARREWRVRGHSFKLPSGKVACLQLVLSSLNWMLIGAVVWVLLQGQAAYPAVLSVLLIAAVAGVITHVPANLGVLEAVFIALLTHSASRHELLAALLAYRAIYYLLPLALAVLHYFVVAARFKRSAPVQRG